MRICKIYDDDYPWDIRIEKIGRSLVEAGHQVFLAVRNRKRIQTKEIVDTMNVRRIAPFHFLPAGLDINLMFPAFFSPRWLVHIANVVTQDKCDVIFVRDLPLALTGLLIGKTLRKPVILDMAENYPAALKAFQKRESVSLTDRIVRNPSVASLIENIALVGFDHILVVAEENRQRLYRKGVDPKKISVVGNTPNLDVFRDTPVPEEIRARFEGAFVLLYIGEVSPYRGLDTVVRALPEIRKRIPNIKLAILGKGDGITEVQSIAQSFGVLEYIDLVGFRPLKELPGYIVGSDVCIIPHHRNEHIDTTLPNKLFDYMALGKPIIATDAAPLKRIIESEGCGRTYKSGDSAAFASLVNELAISNRRREMGERSKRAVLERYNWAVDSKVLTEVFAKLQRG